jgi:hypothetical protein
MSIFHRRNLVFEATPIIADVARPLIARLIQNDADCIAYRATIRHWDSFERPIIEVFAGDEFTLRIEGPIECFGDYAFPLGSQFSCPAGWVQLGPVETNDLVRYLRHELDTLLRDWFTAHRNKARVTPTREVINRAAADQVAIEAMVSCVHRCRQIEALSNGR